MKNATFLSDGIARHTLTFETGADGATLVHGLPIVKAGVWNGEPYTADFLRDVVANTNAGMLETENFLPVSELHPSRDRETKAWIEGLRFDEATQSVLADPVRVADPGVVDKLRNKQYRYTSAETMISEKRLVGAAFVPNPGCKGLVFSLAEQPINISDFPEVEPLPFNYSLAGDPAGDDVQNSAHSATGGTTMKEKLTAWLQKHGLQATPEQVTALAEDASALTGDTPPHKESEAHLGADPRVAQIMQANVELEAKLAAQDKQIATLAEARKVDEVSAYVDRLVTAGKLPPAKRQSALVVLSAHWGEGVKVLDDQGAEVEKPLADVLADMLPTSVNGKPALAFAGAEPDGHTAPEYTEDQLAALAAKAQGLPVAAAH